MKKFLVLAAAICGLAAGEARAAFTGYTGGLTEEGNWQTAAGTTVLENFDGFASGNQIQTLPALGVGFDAIDPGLGLFPGIYLHTVANTPSAPLQLSNMPSGSPTPTYRYADIELFVLPGDTITALGFWNGDPQGVMTITVYDAANNVLGSVSAAINPNTPFDTSKRSFAGFVSDVPFARVHFEGSTGDGWNHIDNLQTNAVHVALSEPGSLAILGFGLAGLGFLRRRRAG